MIRWAALRVARSVLVLWPIARDVDHCQHIDTVFTDAVHDTVRELKDLADLRIVELRDDSPGVGKGADLFGAAREPITTREAYPGLVLARYSCMFARCSTERSVQWTFISAG